jgi:hypothetical protein
MLAVPGPGEGEGCCGELWGDACGEPVGDAPGLALALGLAPGLTLGGAGETPGVMGIGRVTRSVELEQPATTKRVSNSRIILIGEN